MLQQQPGAKYNLLIERLEALSQNSIFGSHLLFGTENKGKAIPLQAWTDPEGSRRLRLPDFRTIGT
jgi:hypothetical protein